MMLQLYATAAADAVIEGRGSNAQLAAADAAQDEFVEVKEESEAVTAEPSEEASAE